MAAPPSAYRPIDRQISEDFKAYWETVDRSRAENATRQKELLRVAHKLAVCFVSLARETADLEEHLGIFLRELASDAVHLVNSIATGDARASRFYLRSAIENFWRHYYFRDHPIEYGWIRDRDGYYLELKELREHCAWLKAFGGCLKPSLDALSGRFAELSKFVHSTTISSLALKTTLQEIKLGTAETKDIQIQVVETLRTTLLLCMSAESKAFAAMHFQAQDFLRRALDADRRRLYQESLGNG
ncbi:hypothetical protein [Bordetella petrii]|uniref:hypothetical protein n=1 Tax=Bordetella petrii TaxID=94624 RepID=UPI001A96A47E|nr:hypothetical protein [Bordetella petrii]MBO1111549.1 hypothetical protein [Bordetella petrii]